MALTNSARGLGRPTPSSELREALAACWHAFIAIGVMSGLINILYLTGSFYMLEIYDRVLPSRDVFPTLVALSILAPHAIYLPRRARCHPLAGDGPHRGLAR